MEEIWKDIPGYEGYYQVSSMGRVKSLKRMSFRRFSDITGPCMIHLKERIMIPQPFNGGYLRVMLSIHDHKKTMSVHDLVAMAFLGYDSKSGLVINHLNGIKNDNRIDNLEITTQKGNMEHAWRTGLCKGGFESPSIKVSKDQAIEMYHLRKSGMSYNDIGAKFGISDDSVKYDLNILAKREPITYPQLDKLDWQGEKHWLSLDVQQIKDGIVVATYGSQREAMRQTGVHHSHIAKCCSGKQKSAGGYEWKLIKK